MKTRVILALTIAIAASTFAQPFGGNYHRTTHCSGTVRDLSGAPGVGVRVSFYSAGIESGFAEVKTDSNGRYDITPQFSNLADGPINPKNTIIARDLERNLAAIEEFSGERTNVDLTLQPAITIAGSVKDVHGLPLSNAEVEFSFLTSKDHAQSDRQSVIPFESRPIKADEMGSFSISALPQGRDYWIRGIKAKGYGSAFARLEAKDTQTNHYTFPTFVVKLADLKLAGRVLDSDGKPVAGAEVRLNGNGQQEWPTTKSGSDGKFVFDEVCEGEVQLSVDAYIGGPPGIGIFMTSNNGMGVKVQAGDTNVVINIRPNGADVGRTPLHNAAHNGDINAVKLLLAGKANVNAKDNQGMTPLHEAARGGYKDIVELLLANKAEVNAKTKNGWTPLHEAAFGGNKEVVALLLAHGADVNAVNSDVQTPLYWAITYHRSDVAQLLRQHGGLEHGYDVGRLTGTMTNWDVFAIQDAIQKNNLPQVKTLLKNNPSLISSKDEQRRTPLILSALAGHADVMELLLASKSDVNAADMFGRTPLHWAALLGHTNIAVVLLENNADVNAKADGGATPLHYAAQNGFKGVAELLVKSGADINATNNAGHTPLHTAELEIRSNTGAAGTPAARIYTARLQGRKDVAEWLRQHGGHE